VDDHAWQVQEQLIDEIGTRNKRKEMGGGIRELIRKHSAVIAIATTVVAVAALGYSLRSAASGTPTASTDTFCTTDEGQTVFVADALKIPPFEHDGKMAVRVAMFTFDGGKTKFPGFLQRYTPEAKRRMEAAMNDPKHGAAIGMNDMEVKKPGSGNPWVSKGNLVESAKVMHVDCPEGKELEVALP
jgi:hypothetical protein